MQTSFANLKGRPVKPPSHWDPFRSAYPQVLAAMVTAVGVFVLALVFLPELTTFFVKCLYVFLHEASHALVAVLGQGSIEAITIDPAGESHAHVGVSGDLHDVVVSGSGLVLPAWLGAWLLLSAVTRRRIEATLLVIGLVTTYLTHRYIDAALPVSISLLGFAAFCLLVAFLPAGGFLKATCAFLVVIAISMGVLQSIDYAWVQWIDNDPARPSDSQNIADSLGLNGVEEVALSLLLLMGLGYCIAGLLAWNWLRRHRE